MIDRSPLTVRDRELMNMETIASQFPVQFSNNAVWTEFDGKCSGCGKTLDRNNVRGLLSKPLPTVATIEAAGVCLNCELLTRFDYRIHNDMRITGRGRHG